jgi:hypothetical protein
MSAISQGAMEERGAMPAERQTVPSAPASLSPGASAETTGAALAADVRDRAASSRALGPVSAGLERPNRASATQPVAPVVPVSAENARPGALLVPAVSPSLSGSPLQGQARESSIVVAAREALRAGDPQRALTLLEAAGSGAAGVLVQERALLEIEALVGLGKREQARERARAFLVTWPESPYARRVQATLQTL